MVASCRLSDERSGCHDPLVTTTRRRRGPVGPRGRADRARPTGRRPRRAGSHLRDRDRPRSRGCERPARRARGPPMPVGRSTPSRHAQELVSVESVREVCCQSSRSLAKLPRLSITCSARAGKATSATASSARRSTYSPTRSSRLWLRPRTRALSGAPESCGASAGAGANPCVGSSGNVTQAPTP